MGRQVRNGQLKMLGIYETTINTRPKGTRIHIRPMSAFGGKADIANEAPDVCFMTQSGHQVHAMIFANAPRLAEHSAL